MPPGRDGEGYSPDIQGKTPRDEIKSRGFVSRVALFFRDVYYNLPGKLSTLQNMNMVWEKLPREKIQSFDDFRGQSESRIGVISSSNPSAASVPYITLVREKLKELNESNSDVLLNAEKHSKNNPVIYVVGTTRMGSEDLLDAIQDAIPHVMDTPFPCQDNQWGMICIITCIERVTNDKTINTVRRFVRLLEHIFVVNKKGKMIFVGDKNSEALKCLEHLDTNEVKVLYEDNANDYDNVQYIGWWDIFT